MMAYILLIILLCHFFVVILLYERTQRGDIVVYCIKNLLFFDFVIPMNQNMTHVSYIFPWNFFMSCSKFFSQHIRSLSNNFNMFYETEKQNWIFGNIFH